MQQLKLILCTHVTLVVVIQLKSLITLSLINNFYSISLNTVTLILNTRFFYTQCAKHYNLLDEIKFCLPSNYFWSSIYLKVLSLDLKQ